MAEGLPSLSWQDKITQAKLKIKKWEGEFKVANSCRPDKAALATAPDDIKAAYKAYHYYRKTLEHLNSATTEPERGTSGNSCTNSLDQKTVDKTVDEESCGTVLKTHSISSSLIPNGKDSSPKNNHSERVTTENGEEEHLDADAIKKTSTVCAPLLSQDPGVSHEVTTDTLALQPYTTSKDNVWGTHLNKSDHQTLKKVNNKHESLYSKMAEKLRARSSIKVRTSLKKSKDSIVPLKREMPGVLKAHKHSSSVETNTDVDACTDKENVFGVASEDKPNSHIPVGGGLSAQDLATADRTLNGQCASRLDTPVPENEKPFVSESIAETKSSIFDTLENNSSKVLFRVQRGQVTKKLQTQAISAISHITFADPQSDLLATRRKAGLNHGWVVRCTGTDVLGEEQEGKDLTDSSESWKMKLIDRDWVSDDKDTQCLPPQILTSSMDDDDDDDDNVDQMQPDLITSSNRRDHPVHRKHKATKTKNKEPVLRKKDKMVKNGLMHERGNVCEVTEKTSAIEETSDAETEEQPKVRRLRSRKNMINSPPESVRTDFHVEEDVYNFHREISSPERETENDTTWVDRRQGRLRKEETCDSKFLDENVEADSDTDSRPRKGVSDEEYQIEEENPQNIKGRKRKKVESLEDLEESGKIQSVWPPPKRKRIGKKKTARTAMEVKRLPQMDGIVNQAAKGGKRKAPKAKMPKAVTVAKRKQQKDTESSTIAKKTRRKVPKTQKLTSQVHQKQNEGLQCSQPGNDDYNELEDIEAHGLKKTNGKPYMSTEERFMKKIATGACNNNFVRINLKKKVFVRGKKGMTGGKYKRQEWKKKQIMKSADGGNLGAIKKLTCFKCGDFGHWSKNCIGKRGDNLLPLENYNEKESTFLSLEEAASMALGIKPCSSALPVSKLFLKEEAGERNDNKDECVKGEQSDGTHEPTGSKVAEDKQEVGMNVDENEMLLNPDDDCTEQSKDDDCTGQSKDDDCTGQSKDDDCTGQSKDDDCTGQSKDDDCTEQPKDDDYTEQSKNNDIFSPMDLDDDIFADMEETDEQNDDDKVYTRSTEPTNTQHSGSSQQPNLLSYNSLGYDRPTVDPLYPLDNGEVGSTPEEVYDALEMFGYSSFRPGQENAIMRVLSGQSTLLVLSTGSGKSLCYQLPAYLYAKHNHCITLCVSPLVSLMEDQVTGLPSFLHAVCLHTHQNTTQRSFAINAIQSGTAHILLVSPEAVVASRSGGVLGSLLKDLPPVAFACLDEAHCVSEWSHNFRPSYLRVCQVLRERLGIQTILGLTATARQATALSIARHLLIPDFDTGVIRGASVPENLLLSVSRDEFREQALITLLQGDRFSECSSIIIYCTRRDECERVATLIRTQLMKPTKVDVKSNLKRTRGISFDAEAYHAGLSSYRRHKIQKQFMSGKLRIVVATVAFGMGIDKADVRGVIHFNMPRNIESYVQEIGRAGRDGEDAHCHLFLDARDGRDIQELKRHIYANSMDRHTVRKLLNKIFKPCACSKVKDLEIECVTREENTNEGNSVEVNSSKAPASPSAVSPPDAPSSPSNSQTLSRTNEANEDSNISINERTSAEDSFSVLLSRSSCPRHEVAIPIDDIVKELDLPEENLATLLCYLELHQGSIIHLNSHAYANCTVSCYGGPRQLVAVSRKCPPLAAAIALERQKGVRFENVNRVSFPVVEVASCMGWNSKIVKRELKSLEWNTQDLSRGGSVKRSGVTVEFTDLSFHMEARGDLSNDERDQLLDNLFKRAQTQEQNQLLQLHYTYEKLRSVSHNSILLCCDSVDMNRCTKLQGELRRYFSKDGTNLSEVQLEEKVYIRPEIEAGVRSSVRAFISTHMDHQWTGRAVARVFHGIGSPNFPTEVWGRVRRFWRQHLNVAFNILVRLATQEILRCK
ncbi:uncharacterized protein LOC121866392 [Homarus americanus]|uniref:DNA 3'-5' helicase n=1 Tax=Homarus americanus TaxID=6706 RepID=A0A8J5MYT7_HOMAM|nr:uncharacterized protein LOC121866392 [Homarus americanus]KAG7168893.1 ATP-dependent DNA helicase Q4-like [Homarus americanus]